MAVLLPVEKYHSLRYFVFKKSKSVCSLGDEVSNHNLLHEVLKSEEGFEAGKSV